MLQTRVPEPRIRKGIFHSFRFHLSFVLFVGVGIPLLLAVGIPRDVTFDNPAVFNSAIFITLAAVALVCVIRRLALFPGNGVAKYILPAHVMIYAAVLGIISALRLDYSNTIIMLGFFSTLAARYAIATLNIRGPQRIYCIVPGGRASVVESLPRMVIVKLEQPELPRLWNSIVVADLRHDHTPEWERLLAEAAISGIPVYHYKQIWEASTGEVQIEHLSENSFGSLIPGLAYRKIKRVADIALCLLALPFVLPVGLAAAIAIKLDDGGPVFFRQQRMGYKGIAFRVCKFRTMRETNDGTSQSESMTQENDDRITRVGNFLRRTRIDELPQIWNIIWGEMSWIGPRPEAVALSAWYEGELPFYRYRHIVRPGITGWAQVNQGHVTSLDDVDHKLQFDFYYIKYISYWMDILIAFKTIRVVLTGFGAK